VLATAAFRYAGQEAGFHDALVEMGFDPDRAQLLTALAAGAIAGGAAALATGRRLIPTTLGLLTLLATFRGVFAAETRAALASGGSQGTFSPVGWLLTVAGLVGAGLCVGWATATLAADVRRALLRFWLPHVRAALAAGRDVRVLRPLGLPAAVTLGALVAVAIGASVFGDMINYSPDADMRLGAPQAIPLAGGRAGGGAGAGVVGGGPAGTGSSDTASLGGSTNAWTSPARPWTAWIPSGSGRVDHLTFPAPWTGGRSQTADVWVYVPPGYDAGTRRYPVLYQAPWTLGTWQHGVQIVPTLDRLITSGRVPAQIVVFVGQGGGPYIWSECADSYDGREHFESYIVSTVVPAIDRRYRTFPEAAARSVMGFSDGGFCAAMLTLRHPDVFASSISFSGYFQAGLRSNQTTNAWRPFGGNATLIADHSPTLLAATLPPAERTKLFVVLVGRQDEPLYGPQVVRFDQALTDAGIPRLVIPDPTGHSWIEVRTELPAALAAVAGREVALGIFGS
jgi:enterochelin esterase-like enzyme